MSKNTMTTNSHSNQDLQIRSQFNSAGTFSIAHLLLIDDHAEIQLYIKRLLSRQYDIETVSNGIQALTVIEQQPPDLVIISLMPHNLNELEFLRQLRANSNTKDLPIIVLSQIAEEEIRKQWQEAGANEYLLQPFSDRELIARLEANLKIAKLQREAERREQALRTKNFIFHNRVSDILESISDAFVAFDHQWQYIYVNQQATKLLHKTREELLGQVVWEIFPELPDLNMLAYRELQRAMRERVVVRFEDFSPTLNRWLEVHVYPIPEGLAVYFQDITDRREVESTLRENEQRLKAANERFELAAAAVNCLIYDWDIEKNIVERTDGITRILGYAPEDIDPSPEWWFNLCHPDDQERIQKRSNVNWITDDRWTAEYRVRHKDGYYIHVLDQGMIAKRDQNGNPIRVVGSTTDISDQKQVEQNFREQQLFLQNITDNVPVLLWTALPDGRIDFVSQPWIDYTGLDLETIQQQGWQDLIHPDDLNETYQLWSEAAAKQQPYEITHRIRYIDGSYRWCISRAVLTGDNQITPLRWVGSAVDIEHQKQTEAALTETTERFRQMAETIEVVFWLSDAFDQQILYVSPAYDRIWGRSREKLYTNFQELVESIHPDDQERVIASASRERLQESIDIEYRIVRPDRQIRWIRDRSYLIQDNNGQPYRLVGFAEDITERKQAQQERQQTLHILQTLIVASPLPIVVIEPVTTNVKIWNRAAEQVFGWSEAEVLGQPIPIVPDEKKEECRLYREALLNGETFLGADTYRCKRNREQVIVSISAAPLYNVSNQVDALLLIFQDITEQKQAEQALRESEANLRQNLAILNTINEATPTLIYVKDRQGRLVMGNSALFRALGKSESEVIGYTDAEFYVNPDEATPIVETDRQVMETGQIQIVEETLELPQGLMTFLSTKSPYRDQTGNIIGLVGVSFDITERKQAQEAVRENEQKLKIALRTGKLGSWQLDLVTNALECSSQMKVNFGLAFEDDISYQRLLGLIHPDDQKKVQQAVQEAIISRTDFDLEFRNIWPDGTLHWLMARGRAIYSSNGYPQKLIGVTLDLSDRKLTEQALQKSEERLRVALEAARLGMWYWELDTDILTWTNQCKALFGLSADATMSYPIFLNSLHPDDRQRTNEAVERSIKLQQDYDIEYRTIWPDGTLHWLAAKGNCVYDAMGQPIRMLGVVLDITERKRTEEELQQTTQDLISLNQELTEATAILQERNQELDQFVYIVSHDLKAPLRAISNLSQWIVDDIGDILPPENQQQMQLLQDRVTRMENLIDGLLNYSRINRTDTATEIVDTQHLLEEIIDSLAPPESFTIEIQSKLPRLNTPRLPLSQVFANLISNAIKHHGRTDGKVTISAKELGKFYQFAVADNGKGIAPEHQEKVFAIFQTVGNESKNNTGIGLAIVKKLVEKHGGKITLESQLGQGTTFRFTWPKSR